jgi:hypothetical protein
MAAIILDTAISGSSNPKIISPQNRGGKIAVINFKILIKSSEKAIPLMILAGSAENNKKVCLGTKTEADLKKTIFC